MNWGLDPEFFVMSKSGKFAMPVANMSNERKAALCTSTLSMKSYEDGSCLEIGSDHPQGCRAYALDYIRALFIQIMENDEEIHAYPAAQLLKSQMKGEQVMRSQCDPENISYPDRPEPVPFDQTRWRCAGGHLHVEVSKEDDRYIRKNINGYMSNVLDPLIGAFSTLVSEYPDLERERRKLYGQAGAYRVREIEDVYGSVKKIVEYRTPSNAYMKYAPTAHLVFGLWKSVHKLDRSHTLAVVKAAAPFDVQKAINEVDIEQLRAIFLACYKATGLEHRCVGRNGGDQVYKNGLGYPHGRYTPIRTDTGFSSKSKLAQYIALGNKLSFQSKGLDIFDGWSCRVPQADAFRHAKTALSSGVAENAEYNFNPEYKEFYDSYEQSITN